MASIADGIRVPLECPHCRQKFDESLSRLKDDPTLTCPACGGSIHVNTRGTANDVSDRLDELERTLHDFGKPK